MKVYISEVQHPQDKREGYIATVKDLAHARRLAVRRQGFEGTCLVIRANGDPDGEVLTYRDKRKKWHDSVNESTLYEDSIVLTNKMRLKICEFLKKEFAERLHHIQRISGEIKPSKLYDLKFNGDIDLYFGSPQEDLSFNIEREAVCLRLISTIIRKLDLDTFEEFLSAIKHDCEEFYRIPGCRLYYTKLKLEIKRIVSKLSRS